MLDKLTVADFSSLVATNFQVVLGPEQRVALELLSAELIPGMRGGGSRGGKREPFSLVFRGPMQAILPQRIYRLEHEAREPIEIFIVPIGTEGDSLGMHYQAIFA